MLVRLGDPPAPVPAPFDAIINAYPNLPGRSRALREMLLQPWPHLRRLDPARRRQQPRRRSAGTRSRSVRGPARSPGPGRRIGRHPRRAGGRRRHRREPCPGPRARRLLPPVRLHPSLTPRRSCALRSPRRGDDGPQPEPGPVDSHRHHPVPGPLRHLTHRGLFAASALRRAASFLVHLAQRGRPDDPGRRVGRPQRQRAPQGLRQGHRRPGRGCERRIDDALGSSE